ncbi:MAG: hypothetical protein PVJ57_15210 [Phycisphaerae bacterium]|jgi:hypothetical protein
MPQTFTIDSLLAMGRTGNQTQFIQLASTALAQGVQHDELCLLAVQCLAERGLLRRAAALAEGLSPAVRDAPDFAQLRRVLETGTPGGQVAWHRFAGQFAANLDVLRRRYDWADRLAEAWQEARPHLELHVTRDAVWQVYDSRENAAGGWRPCFGDHRPLPPADEFAAQFRGKILVPFVIDGVGLGYHLPWLHAATADTMLGATALIYQVEASLPALAVAMHLHDWRELIADPRVRLCAGPQAYDQLAQWLDADRWNFPPVTVVAATPWDPHTTGRAREVMTAFAERDAVRQAGLENEVRTLYEGRDGQWWHRRFTAALAGEGPPLRVLGMTSRFTTVLQYSARDALAGFAEAGWQTRMLIEPDDHSRISPRQRLETVREFEPDLLLLIDHTRYNQKLTHLDNLPIVTWVQDRLPWLFSSETGENLGPLDFCIGFCRDELVRDYGYAADRFLASEMATRPAALRPVDDETERAAAERLGCDAAYATNCFTAPDQFHADFRKRQHEIVRRLVDVVYEDLCACAARNQLNGGFAGERYINRRAQALGVDLPLATATEVMGVFVRPLIDRLLRLQTIEWTAEWAEETGHRFHLYGNGWDAHPRYARYARGYLPHGPELGAAFRSAKVNLHSGCNTALHQRVLDGLAAGGFFLVRRHADDLDFAIKSALRAAVYERDLQPGDLFDPQELPPPLASQWTAILNMRSVDPTEPVRITPDIVRWAHDDQWTTPTAGEIWPELDRITFATRDEFRERLTQFLSDDAARAAIAADMREQALATFGYGALVRRVLAWLTERLGADEPQQPTPPASRPVQETVASSR